MKNSIVYLLILFSVVISCKSQNNWIYQDFVPDNDIVPVTIDRDETYLNTKKGEIAKGAAPFEEAGCFYGGIALVKNNGKYFYINKKFEPINNEEYVEASIFNQGRAWTVKDFGKITAIDTKGKEVFVLDDAEEAYPFRDGVAVFKNHEGKYGLVNVDGRIVVNAVYDYMDKCSRHNAVRVGVDSKYGIIDISGKEIMACAHNDVTYDKNSRLIGVVAYGNADDSLYSLSSKKEIVLKKGHNYLRPELKGIYRFADDFSHYGWCDEKGKVIIYPKYYYKTWTFDNSKVALVSDKEESASLINRKGDIVSDLPANPQMVYGSFDENGLILVEFSNFVEAVNEKGEIVISNQYDYIWHVSKSIYLCHSDNGTDIVNEKGNIISSYSGDIRFYDKTLIEDWDKPHDWPESVNNRYVDIDGIVSDIDLIFGENSMPNGITPGLVLAKYGMEDMGSKTIVASGEKSGFSYDFIVRRSYDYSSTTHYISSLELDLDLKGAADRNYEVRNSVYSKIKEYYSGNDNSREVLVPAFSDYQSTFREGTFTFKPNNTAWINGVWQADLGDGYTFLSLDFEKDWLIDSDLAYDNMGLTYKYSIDNNIIKITGESDYYLINYDEGALYYNGTVKMTKTSRIPYNISNPFSNQE